MLPENTGWMWWLTPLFSALERQRMMDFWEFKASMVYIVCCKSSRDYIVRLYLKTTTATTSKERIKKWKGEKIKYWTWVLILYTYVLKAPTSPVVGNLLVLLSHVSTTDSSSVFILPMKRIQTPPSAGTQVTSDEWCGSKLKIVEEHWEGESLHSNLYCPCLSVWYWQVSRDSYGWCLWPPAPDPQPQGQKSLSRVCL